MVAAGVAPQPRRGQEQEDRPASAEAEESDSLDTISLVWTELPDSTPPPGRPVG
jgi:hypothetical protein